MHNKELILNMSTITKLAHPFTVWDSLLYKTLPVSLTRGRQTASIQYNCMPNLLYIIHTCMWHHVGNLLYYYILYIQNVKPNLITLAKMGIVYSSTVL